MSYMEIRNLKKVYNPYGIHPKVALNGLDFEVEKGDFICIMGTSGSGKTTLVNILSTIDEATHGQILLNQKDLLLLSEKEKDQCFRDEGDLECDLYYDRLLDAGICAHVLFWHADNCHRCFHGAKPLQRTAYFGQPVCI